MPELVTINSKDHFEELISATPPSILIIKFGATWCRPCQKVQPKFQSFAEKTEGGVTCACVDTTQKSDLQDLAIQVGANAIPFFAVFYGNRLLASQQTSNIEQVRVLVDNTITEIARCDSEIISHSEEDKDKGGK
jgi:thioredoxin 1